MTLQYSVNAYVIQYVRHKEEMLWALHKVIKYYISYTLHDYLLGNIPTITIVLPGIIRKNNKYVYVV